MLEKNLNKVYIYGAQVLFVLTLCGVQGVNVEYVNKWLPFVARFTVYILLIHGFNEACFLIYSYYITKKKINVKNILLKSKQYIIIVSASITLLIYNKIQIITEEFLLFFIAYLITKYPEINQSLDVINYGVGMACSFFEGYLVHIIPSDGHKFVGFEENIAAYEATHQIVFPVKRLIIVITKSLFCPPNLTHFNKTNKNIPFLEDCTISNDILSAIDFGEAPHKSQNLDKMISNDILSAIDFGEAPHKSQNLDKMISNDILSAIDFGEAPHKSQNLDKMSLSDVEKDVAGVTNRIYRNSAYKIHRPGAAVVYLSAECATPLHTLHRVLDKTALYDELTNVDRNELRDDFSEMLKSIISRSPEARGKCELVFFDGTRMPNEDPTQNLADVLLDKIRELEPDFENIITKKK